MDYKLTREYDYIPTWNGNQQEPDPIKFRLRLLSTDQRDDAIRQEIHEDGTVGIVPNKKRLIMRGIVSIENFSIDGQSIKTAADWLRAPSDMMLDTLYAEVSTEIMAKNFGDKKK